MTETECASTPRYPAIVVQLVGTDGNAFAILGTVLRALRRAGIDDDEVSNFREEATAGDYDGLLRACMAWVTVE